MYASYHAACDSDRLHCVFYWYIVCGHARVYVCVCMCVYVCVCTRVLVCVRVSACMHVYVCMSVIL